MAVDIRRFNIIGGFTAKTREYNQDLDNAVRKTKGFQSTLEGAKATALGFLAVEAFTGFIRGIGQATNEAVRLATEFEQTTIAFETFLGSADAAAKVLQDLQDFSVKTPFEPDEIINTGRQLLAFGIETEKLLPTLDALGNVAAGTGSNIQDLAFVYGQIRTQQTLYTQDLNQFASRGIPVYDILAERFNTTAKGVKELAGQSKISFDDIEAAFQSLTSEGGKFFNLIQAQSQSRGGLVSTLRGIRTEIAKTFGSVIIEFQKQILPSIIEQTGAFLEKLRPVADLLIRSIEPFLSRARTILRPLAERAREFIDALGGGNASTRQTVEIFLEEILSRLAGISNILQSIIGVSTQVVRAVNIIIGAIGNLFGISNGFLTLRNAILVSLGGIVGAFRAAAVVIEDFVNGVELVITRTRANFLRLRRFLGGNINEGLLRDLDARAKELDAAIINFGTSFTGAFKEGFESVFQEFEVPDVPETLKSDLGDLGKDLGKDLGEDIVEETRRVVQELRLLPSSSDIKSKIQRELQLIAETIQDADPGNTIANVILESFRGNAPEFSATDGINLPTIRTVNQEGETPEDAESRLVNSVQRIKDVYLDFYDSQIQKIDELISKQEERTESFREIAEQGNAEQLQLEEERLSKLLELRERFAERQRALDTLTIASSQAATVAGAIKAIFTDSLGPVAGVAQALIAISGIATIISSINSLYSDIPSFAEGIESLNTGVPYGDGYLIQAHPKERIVPAEINKAMGSISNAELPLAVMQYKQASEKIKVPTHSNDDVVIELRKSRSMTEELMRYMRKQKAVVNIDKDGIKTWHSEVNLQEKRRKRLIS